MPDCDPTTCRYVSDLRHALEVTEAALARSQDRCDKLRYRNPDFPAPTNTGWPRLWERTDIEDWLTRHPLAGRKR